MKNVYSYKAGWAHHLRRESGVAFHKLGALLYSGRNDRRGHVRPRRAKATAAAAACTGKP
jgi:hypothetical protein